ncbi:MAG: hypothetical protein O6940_05865 [Ignavibacteria bacterium]|nr:hypothetical protein [Ignavibacteria bacterium]
MAKKIKKNVNPEHFEKVKNSNELEEFIAKTMQKIARDQDDQQTYIDKLASSFQLRVGKTEPSNVPWPGASNVRMPFIDKLIRKSIPPIVGSVINTRKPVVVKVDEFVNDPNQIFRERAIKVEKAMNTIIKRDKNLLENLIQFIDYYKEKGRAYFKVVEKVNKVIISKILDIDDLKKTISEEQLEAAKKLAISEIIELIVSRVNLDLDINNDEDLVVLKDIAQQFKKGVENIRYTVSRHESFPVTIPIPAERIILPSNSPRDIQKCWRVTHEFFMNEVELQRSSDSGMFDKALVEAKLETGTNAENFQRSLLEIQKDLMSGITTDRDQQGRFRLWEIYVYWKRKNEKEISRYVITTFANEQSMKPLRVIKMPNDTNQWPFVQHDNEVRDDRAFESRGIPEMVADIQKLINQMENNKINRDIINNTPMFTYKKSSGFESDDIQFIPGEGIGVDNHNDIQFFKAISGVDVSSERIEQVAKQFGEEFIGSIDFSFTGGRASGVSKGANTLGEIQIAQSEAQKLANLDMLLFHNTLSKVYEMMFNILKDKIGSPIFIDGVELTKIDFEFPAEIRSNGKLEDSDRLFKSAQILNRMQIAGQQDPSYVTLEDKFNLFSDYLQSDGVIEPERYSTNPVEVLQDQTVQLQQQVAQLQQQAQQLAQFLEDGQQDLVKQKEDTRRASMQTNERAKTSILKNR